jgi:hypothetical protein
MSSNEFNRKKNGQIAIGWINPLVAMSSTEKKKSNVTNFKKPSAGV